MLPVSYSTCKQLPKSPLPEKTASSAIVAAERPIHLGLDAIILNTQPSGSLLGHRIAAQNTQKNGQLCQVLQRVLAILVRHAGH